MRENYIAILAAGKGTRMKSDNPKILHPICGKPMVQYILDLSRKLKVKKIFIIVGHRKENIVKVLPKGIVPIFQNKQLGTGHAINQLNSRLKNLDATLIVLCADVPFVTENTLRNLIEHHSNTQSEATVLTAKVRNPQGYGRILKRNDRITGIVEELDASPETKKINEINTGIYCFETKQLFSSLKEVNAINNKKEYYLTDTIAILNGKGLKVSSYSITNENEIKGINTKIDLAWAEKYYNYEILKKLMLSGITIIDPATTFVSPDTEIGKDTTIHPFSFIEGKNVIGKNCKIGPQIKIKNCRIEDEAEIFFSVITDSCIKRKATIGPFTHIRPQTTVDNEAHVGSFVEVKKSYIGKKTKVGHLSYIGDSTIGQNVNIGAGTITCNFDGIKKHQTIIENGAFIGSNTQLIAPVNIGKNALVGAGSTITKDVPSNALAIARSKQTNIPRGAIKKIGNKKGKIKNVRNQNI